MSDDTISNPESSASSVTGARTAPPTGAGIGPHQAYSSSNVRVVRVMCSGRVDPHVRPQGTLARRRRRHDRGLPPGRVPLPRAELQGHPALRHAARRRFRPVRESTSNDVQPAVWASAAEGQHPRRPRSTRLVADVKGARPARTGPRTGAEDPRARLKRCPAGHRRRARTRPWRCPNEHCHNGRLRLAKGQAESRNSPSTGQRRAEGARSRSWPSTRRSWTWPTRSTSSSVPASWTRRPATSRKMEDGDDRRLPVQRRDPQQRAGVHGSAAAQEVQGARRLRLVRHEGCIPGLANTSTPRKRSSTDAYVDSVPRPRTPTASSRSRRARDRRVDSRCTCPSFYDTLKTLDQTVPSTTTCRAARPRRTGSGRR
jgi:hypothetical protein